LKKVILFGSIPLATKCLKAIIKRHDTNILGVCCTDIHNKWQYFDDEETVFEFCNREKIRHISHSDILNMDPDIGFSIRYHKIIEKEVIDKFKLGIINIHGGILPKYKGTYSNIHSILNGEQEYGVTLHYIDENIDNGDIIDILSEPIDEDDTGFDLFLKSLKLGYEILIRNLDDLLYGKNKRVKQSSILNNTTNNNIYYKKDIDMLKYIPYEKLGDRYSFQVIKAFSSPYHEPAFTVINNKKIYLKYKYI